MISAIIVFIIWLLTLYAWVSNIIYNALNGIYTPLIIFLIIIPLTFILYLAEGLEIAVADLRDKDASQLANESTREILAQIQPRADFFFGQRQIFVVAIISFISLLIADHLDSFYVYGLAP